MYCAHQFVPCIPVRFLGISQAIAIHLTGTAYEEFYLGNPLFRKSGNSQLPAISLLPFSLSPNKSMESASSSSKWSHAPSDSGEKSIRICCKLSTSLFCIFHRLYLKKQFKLSAQPAFFLCCLVFTANHMVFRSNNHERQPFLYAPICVLCGCHCSACSDS
jgi:hypothetical protein